MNLPRHFRLRAIAIGTLTVSALIAAPVLAKGTLVYCSEGSPEGFQPQFFSTGTTFDAVSVPMFNRLVEFEIGTTNIIPALAESWTVSPDGKTYTFKLHSGAKWSDGQPLTSEDVAWTANTIIKYPGPTAVLAASVAHVTKVDAPDPTTAVFHYDKPVGNALAQLTFLYILPKHEPPAGSSAHTKKADPHDALYEVPKKHK